jgi:hypothetical protein
VRKLIVVASSLAVFGAGWCFGQAQHGNDGNSWHTLPSAVRRFYVAGFSEGYALGVGQTTVLAIAKNAPEKVSSMKPVEMEYYQETLRWAKRIVPFELSEQKKSVKNLENTLDTFYSDYRNTPVCLDEATLFSMASLAGNAAPDQELDAARKKGAESECK